MPLRVIWSPQQSRTVLRNPFCSREGAWELLRAEAWGHLCKSPSWLTLGVLCACWEAQGWICPFPEKHQKGGCILQLFSCLLDAVVVFDSAPAAWSSAGPIRVAPSRVSFFMFRSQMKLNCWKRPICTNAGWSQTHSAVPEPFEFLSPASCTELEPKTAPCTPEVPISHRNPPSTRELLCPERIPVLVPLGILINCLCRDPGFVLLHGTSPCKKSLLP